jgi:hypothetical protein
MPEIAPTGNPMAISSKVTQVCWIKSPSRKPLNSEVKMRLGLLIKKGSIHRPEAISHRKKKPPMMATRMTVTLIVPSDKMEPLGVPAASLEGADRGCSWLT